MLQETKDKISKNSARIWLGKHLPRETREKMSKAQKGRIPWNKGKPMSQETKNKVSMNRKGKGFGKRKPLSEEHKRKIMLANKGKFTGENSWRWIKDRTKLKKSERHDLSYAYRSWRMEVYKRDNFQCRLLNSDCCGHIEAHHIFSWKNFPKLRYIINNGITLCAFHHPRGRGGEKEKRMIPIFQELLSVSKE